MSRITLHSFDYSKSREIPRQLFWSIRVRCYRLTIVLLIESWQHNNRFPLVESRTDEFFSSFPKSRNLYPICSHDLCMYLSGIFVCYFDTIQDTFGLYPEEREYGRFFDTLHGRWQQAITPALIASPKERLINERE